MYCRCYLRKGVVYIPTAAKISDGFYNLRDPVAVVPSANADQLFQSFKDTISRGNPKIPAPQYPRTDKPDVLKYANVKTWSAFARGTATWAIDEKDGQYQIKIGRRRPDRGWEDDPDRIVTLPSGSTVDDLCARMVAIIQEVDRAS